MGLATPTEEATSLTKEDRDRLIVEETQSAAAIVEDLSLLDELNATVTATSKKAEDAYDARKMGIPLGARQVEVKIFGEVDPETLRVIQRIAGRHGREVAVGAPGLELRPEPVEAEVVDD